MDAWSEMDAWCKVRVDRINAQVEAALKRKGVSVNDPQICRLVGRAKGYSEMRSYIHHARNAPSPTGD